MFRRHLTALLVIPTTLFCVYFSYQRFEDLSDAAFIEGDGLMYFAIVISITDDGDLILNNNSYTGRSPLAGQYAYGPDMDPNRLVPKHPIVMPLFALPFYSVGDLRGLEAFVLLVTVALGYAIYLLLTQLVSRRAALGTALLFSSATLVVRYTYLFYSDTFGTLFVVLGLYLAISKRRTLSAICIGIAIWAKVPNGAFAAIIFAYVVFDILREAYRRPDGRARRAVTRLGGYTLASVLAQVPHLTTNFLLYGSPIVTGYHRTARGAEIRNHADEFTVPLMEGLETVLFDGARGIFPTNPVLGLAVIGLFLAPFHKRRAELVTIAVMMIAQVSIIAKFQDAVASPYSNRFLITTVILAAAFAALVVERTLRWLRRAAVT